MYNIIDKQITISVLQLGNKYASKLSLRIYYLIRNSLNGLFLLQEETFATFEIFEMVITFEIYETLETFEIFETFETFNSFKTRKTFKNLSRICGYNLSIVSFFGVQLMLILGC